MHSALAEKLPPGRSTKEDLPTTVVLAVFRDQLAGELADLELGEGESAADLQACGELLVKTYMDQASSIEQAAVELHVAGERSAACRRRGYTDVMDVNGDVIVRTASKKPSGVRADIGSRWSPIRCSLCGLHALTHEILPTEIHLS